MAAKVGVLMRPLADLNVVARSEFRLKPEQQVAVKFLLDGKDVLERLKILSLYRTISEQWLWFARNVINATIVH